MEKPTKNVLEDLYVKQGLTDQQIAAKFNRSPGAVFYWRECYGIEARSKGVLKGTKRPAETRARMSKSRLKPGVIKPSKEKLYQLYWSEQMSDDRIAEMFNCSNKTISYWRRQYEIPSKTKSEAAVVLSRTEENRRKMSELYRGRKFSPETKKAMSESKLEKIYESQESFLEAVESAKKMRKNGRYILEGKVFDSKSEAAIGILLERYVPNYQIVSGLTFQANQDVNCIFDFILPNVIIEYHPIRIEFELEKEDKIAYRQLIEEAKTKEQRQEISLFRKQLKDELATEYWFERQAASDRSKFYQGKEVVLATNFNQFYNDVLQKYADKTKLGSKFELAKEFDRLRNMAVEYRSAA